MGVLIDETVGTILALAQPKFSYRSLW